MFLSPQIVLARQQYFNEFMARYPNVAGSSLSTCNVCHVNWNYKQRNNFGNDFKSAGKNLQAIENYDSDHDNHTNIQEINALTFPGDATSVPTPAPDIKVNGQDGPITITSSGSAAISISCNAHGFNSSADWWIVLHNADGWFYFSLSGQGYLPGITATYQGTLFDLGSYPLFTAVNLPSGANTFYFGVDLTQDGEVTHGASQLSYDSIVVTVQ